MNHYELLGISNDCGFSALKKAYYRRARECHPDRFGNSPEKAEEFKQVVEAFVTLSDPEGGTGTAQRLIGRLAEDVDACEGAVLVLASATPSILSFAKARRGDYMLLEMPFRVNERPLPEVEITDMRSELEGGNRSVLSGALKKALKECAERGEQAILLMNRRGYNSFVSCRSCDLCRLPLTDYVCPETCPKGLANGSCGCNKADNGCELMSAECVYAKRLRIANSRVDYSSLEDGAVPPVEARP